MALINCTECGKDVSNKAVACPHCGAKPPKPTKNHRFPVAAILVIGVFAWVNHQLSTPESPEARAEKEREYEQAKAECSMIGAKAVNSAGDVQSQFNKGFAVTKACLESRGYKIQ